GLEGLEDRLLLTGTPVNPLKLVSIAPPPAVEGAAITNAVVARFTDANKLAVAKDHTALVSWGDGSTTAGAVVADPRLAHTFNVLASHTYIAEGQDLPFTVTVSDTAKDTAALHSTIDVADAAKKGAVSFTAVEQKLFAGVVAKF